MMLEKITVDGGVLCLLWFVPLPVLGWFWLVPLLLRPTKEPQMAI